MNHDTVAPSLSVALEHFLKYLLLLRVKVVIFCSDDLGVEEVGRATHNALGAGVLSDTIQYIQSKMH